MNKFIIIISLFSTYFVTSQGFSELEIFDYLSYDYKFLNSSFEIEMDSTQFNKSVSEYKFIKERILKYNDSLA